MHLYDEDLILTCKRLVARPVCILTKKSYSINRTQRLKLHGLWYINMYSCVVSVSNMEAKGCSGAARVDGCFSLVVVQDAVDIAVLVHGEGDPVQRLGAHHAAEAARMVRVAQRLQDLVTRRHTLVKPSTTIQTCQANTHRHVNRQVNAERVNQQTG